MVALAVGGGMLPAGVIRPASLQPAAAIVPREAGLFEAPQPDDVRSVAKEAYVWGWPMAYVHALRLKLERVPAIGKSGGMPVAPLNRLAMLTDRIQPRSTLVACPNQDVIYGFGIFDLAASPVVLQIPDFGERFWLYQLGDQRTDGFADVGSMHGTRPGCYLVVGPAWDGRVPPGITGVFRSPTRFAFCIPRIFFANDEADRLAALPAVNHVVAYPLAEFTGELQRHDWSRVRWLPDLAARGRHPRGVSPESFFEALPELLDDVPPLPGEEPLYAQFRRLARTIAADPARAAEAIAAAEESEREVLSPLFEFRNVGLPLSGHWTTLVNGAAFGTDYLTRLAVARSNVFVNRQCETKYYYQDLDALGRRLHGSRSYRITFPPTALPPARAFWSLTVYDERHALPQGNGGRRTIGSRDPDLVFGPDGSLTIVISDVDSIAAGTRLAASPEANRLAPPPGEFSLYLRIYWPEETAVAGEWTPPPVRVESDGPSLAMLHKTDGVR
ncbi:MAG: DUF1254 domain-containing protein [Planctomycetia bacterium]